MHIYFSLILFKKYIIKLNCESLITMGDYVFEKTIKTVTGSVSAPCTTC